MNDVEIYLTDTRGVNDWKYMKKGKELVSFGGSERKWIEIQSVVGDKGEVSVEKSRIYSLIDGRPTDCLGTVGMNFLIRWRLGNLRRWPFRWNRLRHAE